MLATVAPGEPPKAQPIEIYDPAILGWLTLGGIPLAVAAEITAKNWRSLGHELQAIKCRFWMAVGGVQILIPVVMAIVGYPLGLISTLVIWISGMAGCD